MRALPEFDAGPLERVWRAQGSEALSEPSKPEEGIRTLPRAERGSYTGLDLPKSSWGGAINDPDIQPMREGLPDTPIEACRELMLAIVMQAMRDNDVAYVMSTTFNHHLLYIGLDPDAALQVKIAYLQGRKSQYFTREAFHAARRVNPMLAVWP
ncbi:hypothetical protein QTH97_02265 [Variovorax sp. J22R24]|uniref:hypothetical protein n=1 Tax=Variovorax gracilis TaxID=3053502 RepID=UPI0025791BDA|nr:hypothetical protein [Variovorax sp. J22R24]MDM0103741.1 hypothetical protein [Variovorax sp. J22R24]